MPREPWIWKGACGGQGEPESGPPDGSPPSPGAAALMLLLPVTMFHLLLVARSGPARLLGPPPYLPGLEELWSPWALLLCLTWLGLQAALYLLPARKVWPLLANARGRRRRAGARREGRPPSTLIRTALCPQVAEGQELKDKSRLRYPINGAWGLGPCVELRVWRVEPQAQWEGHRDAPATLDTYFAPLLHPGQT